VRQLIAAVRTVHNRTYFWTVYSLGLRLGEGLHWQVGDIDSARMRVQGHRGKGAKDRYGPLPSSTLAILPGFRGVSPLNPAPTARTTNLGCVV
jgi:integrase